MNKMRIVLLIIIDVLIEKHNKLINNTLKQG